MKKVILTFTLLLLAYSAVVSQRRLRGVSDPMPDAFDKVVVDNHVYVAEHNGTTLRRYDGTLSIIPYPIDGVLPLRYSDDRSGGFLSYNAKVYLVLHNVTTRFFYGFDGTTYTRFPVELFSNLVIYRNKIYMMARRVGGAIRLFSYDGSSLLEMSSPLTVSTSVHTLKAGGEYLYLMGNWGSTDSNYVLQYTGSAVRTTPLPESRISEILPIAGTDDSYIRLDNHHIYFYDGTTFINISRSPDFYIERTGLVLSGNVLYFQEDEADLVPGRLVRCVGTTCSEIPIPEGRLIRGGSQNAIYRGELYVPIQVGGSDYIYRYDGTTFNRVFAFSETTDWPILQVRQGKLLITPRQDFTDVVYEYDGTSSIWIRTPYDDQVIHESGESTFCYHTWSMSFLDEATPPQRKWVLAIERPDTTCIAPPPGGPVSIIPDRLREYDHFWGGAYAPERGWCWNEIILDWFPPLCTQPPCGNPPEEIQTTLTDMKGQLAFSKISDKPFSVKFPVKDTEPYTLSVSVGNDDTFEPVLLYDHDLVNKGVEAVSIDMFPKEDYFYMKVDTRKQQQVPISLTLRNTKGEALWQENFTAPMDKLIRAYVSKPGDYLQVSLQQKTSGASYYPNPFKENLTLEVAEGTAPVSISLSDLNGKVMFQTKIPGPGKHSINVGSQKSGLYILTIVEGELTRRELVKIE